MDHLTIEKLPNFSLFTFDKGLGKEHPPTQVWQKQYKKRTVHSTAVTTPCIVEARKTSSGWIEGRCGFCGLVVALMKHHEVTLVEILSGPLIAPNKV